MRYLMKKLCNLMTSNYVKRYLHTSIIKNGYEGPGKTTINFMSREAENGLMIKSVNSWGFTLNNGINIIGSMVIFPKSIISWNVATTSDITEESLVLFTILEPKLDILVLGLDKKSNPNSQLVKNIRSLLRKANISYEILPVDKAVGVFNFLNSDQRFVAGAMIAPNPTELIPNVSSP